MTSTDIESLAHASITPEMVGRRLMRLIWTRDYHAARAERETLVAQLRADSWSLRKLRHKAAFDHGRKTDAGREYDAAVRSTQSLYARFRAVRDQMRALRPLVYHYHYQS